MLRWYHRGMLYRPLALLVSSLVIWAPAACAQQPPGLTPGTRTLVSAHNCYPYHGLWANRIDRALSTGVPIAIEQDLCWVEGDDGAYRSVVSHGEPFDGSEPTLASHFFERIRPIIEKALEADARSGDRSDWPLIVLDLDIKHGQREHIEAIRDTLLEHESWLTTAERVADGEPRSPLDADPVLVLVGGDRTQQAVFHDEVPVGGRVIAFGRASVSRRPDGVPQHEVPPEQMVTERADNFRRWWNNSWHAVESGGAPGGGDWTDEDEARLESLVDHAHSMGYFIRFYAINGCTEPASKLSGWSDGYNTGSIEAARVRWRAAAEAGVDFMATDDYEGLAEVLRGRSPPTP